MGPIRLMRKIWAAKSDPSLLTSKTAELVEELKRDGNATIYEMGFSKSGLWSDAKTVLEKNRKEMEAFDRRIDMNRNDRKEEIKSMVEAGDFALKTGLYADAAVKYNMALEQSRHVSTVSQMLPIVKKLNVVCVIQSQKIRTMDYVLRVLNAGSSPTEEDDRLRDVACVKAGVGAVSLASGDFRGAANMMCDPMCTIAMGTACNDLLLPQHVAMYGGLSALATFSRSELKSNVIDNDSFKDFLDASPDIGGLIRAFFDSDYDACMKLLSKIDAFCKSDLIVGRHWEKLRSKIVDNMMVQYFRPYSRARMDVMAKAFNMSVEDIEKFVSKLIISKKMSARIDSENKVLIANAADERSATFDKVLANGEAFVDDIQTSLLRLSLKESGLMLRRSGKGTGHRQHGSLMSDMLLSGRF